MERDASVPLTIDDHARQMELRAEREGAWAARHGPGAPLPERAAS
jgi:hypothetical protein